MEKIPTIFNRNWDGDKKIINIPRVNSDVLKDAKATEKLNGTNVRLTVRNHLLVRIEKRRNPTPVEKAKGIVDPWYVDCDLYDSQDKYIIEAAKGTDLKQIEDGEWSGEAIGEKIQGNPLKITGHTVVLFAVPTIRDRLTLNNVPVDYNELKSWLPNQKSKIGTGTIEGVVWWKDGEPVGKIKLVDYQYEGGKGDSGR